MTGDQPVGVVLVGELKHRQAQVLDGLKVAHPQQVLLEGANEALGDAVPSGLRTKPIGRPPRPAAA
jgi:hypothetical protein